MREFSHLAADQIPYVGNYFTWMVAGPFRVDFALQVDQLTVVMLLVVSFVGMLIHIYSTGYMAHEGGYYRFFSYLNLFMFFMLTLVLAANLIVMFVGWEGVGLCSYLLIGFWYPEKIGGGRGQESIHRHAYRRSWALWSASCWCLRRSRLLISARFSRISRRIPGRKACSRRFACCYSLARSANRRSFRCTSGCRTRWKAPRPSAP